MSRSDLSLALVLSCVALPFYAAYTLQAPYFLDSYGYLQGIEALAEGDPLRSQYRLANVLLHYFPVRLFGELGLTLVSLASTTWLAGLYFLLLRRDFCVTTSIAAWLLFFSFPSTFITATHLKEDLTSLACFAACLLLIPSGPRIWRWVGAGVAYGFALLFKEVMLAAFPFVAAYAYLRRSNIESYRELLSASNVKKAAAPLAWLSGAAFLTIVCISPTRFLDFSQMSSSPYMGQFLGVFSFQFLTGLDFWTEALLYLNPWLYLAAGAFLAAARRAPRQALYLAMAVVMFHFLANITVVRMRHYVAVFFFLAPVLAEGIRFAASRRPRLASAVTVGLAALVAGLQLHYITPTAEYRVRYPSHRGYFAPLGEMLPPDALLLGMDDCPIAEYESGLVCTSRAPDPDAEEAEKFALKLAAEARPVYALPDFYTYDRHRTVRNRIEEQFDLAPVYTGWYENYHTMSYGRSVADLVDYAFGGCETTINREPREISERLQAERVEFVVNCGSRPVRIPAIVYRNRVTALKRAPVLLLAPKDN